MLALDPFDVGLIIVGAVCLVGLVAALVGGRSR